MMYEIFMDATRLWMHGLQELTIYDTEFEQEINKAGSLKFTMPPEHLLYNDLKKLSTTISLHDTDGNVVWTGRILNDSRNFYNQKEVYCEGAFGFLNDSMQEPVDEDNAYDLTIPEYFSELIETHNQQVGGMRGFTVGECTIDGNITVERSGYDNTISIIEQLLEDYGGFIKITYDSDGAATIHYVEDYQELSTQPIKFGVNLLDFTNELDASEICTVLYATGQAGEDSEDVFTVYTDEESASIYGNIARHEDFGEVADEADLVVKCQEYFASGKGRLSDTIELKAADLSLIDGGVDQIHLGDIVHITSKPHDMNAVYRCTKLSFALENPADAEYTFGEMVKGLSDQQLEMLGMMDDGMAPISGIEIAEITRESPFEVENATSTSTTTTTTSDSGETTTTTSSASTIVTNVGQTTAYFSDDVLMVPVDTTYRGHPVTSCSEQDRRGIIQTIYGEQGMSLGGSILVAQAIRDTFDYFDDSVYAPYNADHAVSMTWRHVVDKHFSIHVGADYYLTGQDANLDSPDYSVAIEAYDYVFVQGKSGVHHRIFYCLDASKNLGMDFWEKAAYFSSGQNIGYPIYAWSTTLFDTFQGDPVWVSGNREIDTHDGYYINSKSELNSHVATPGNPEAEDCTPTTVTVIPSDAAKSSNTALMRELLAVRFWYGLLGSTPVEAQGKIKKVSEATAENGARWYGNITFDEVLVLKQRLDNGETTVDYDALNTLLASKEYMDSNLETWMTCAVTPNGYDNATGHWSGTRI